MLNAENLIILVSLTLLLSYISSLFYSITRIPDVIFLMGFGILMGPVLNYVDKTLFDQLAPLMSILALSIILFEAGINVDIISLIDSMGKATILSVLSIVSSILIVGVLVSQVLMPQDFTLLQGMLLGAMVGGTSTVAVFGILSGIGSSIPDMVQTRILLTMESIISDPICIISSITLIKMVMQPDVSVYQSFKDIISTFILSSLMGLGLGLLWARILDKLKKRPYSYMITLGVLLPAYIISERVIGAGSGAMTALTFGLAITNYQFIMNIFKTESDLTIDKLKLREFHDEITFFIKSFFFVYIGVVATTSLKFMLFGFIIVLAQMLMRFSLVELISKPLMLTTTEKVLSQSVYASGLPAFVMSQLPLIFDPDKLHFINPGIYPVIAMPIVLGTILYSSFIGPFMVRRELSSNRKKPAPILTEQELYNMLWNDKALKKIYHIG